MSCMLLLRTVSFD